MQPTSEKGKLPIPEPPSTLKMMMENNSSDEEREVWESLNDLIIERAEAIMYKGGIQALELLKADKKTIDTLKKNLKEEESFGDWLERNNPIVAKRLMTNQVEKNKKRAKKSKRQESEQVIGKCCIAYKPTGDTIYGICKALFLKTGRVFSKYFSFG